MSNLSIVQGTNNKHVATGELIGFLSSQENLDGELFTGYPIINGLDGRYAFDAVWVSPSKGVIIFDLIEGLEVSDFDKRQDNAVNKLEARLRTYEKLMKRRNLVVPINAISFAPGLSDKKVRDYSEQFSDYPLCNKGCLLEALEVLSWTNFQEDYYRNTISALQSISKIRKSNSERLITKLDSRGAKLKLLEDSISTLDNTQSKAVIETVQGVQRIRGLAGSGKTIVLALKAAYLHAQNRDWKIAVTFHTRALKNQFRKLINTFSIEQTGEEPDWGKIKILNAWGAPENSDQSIDSSYGDLSRDGIYFQFCRLVDAPYFDFKSAQNKFGKGKEFESVCDFALGYAAAKKIKQHLYNVILVDEAQDFPKSFLRLCYSLLDDEKRLVYAYDELQNLSGNSLGSPSEIFGNNPDGTPKVVFRDPQPGEPKQDIILEKCYRNSKPILVTAHALGFGIYRPQPPGRSTGLVQMFDQAELWRDIGYELQNADTLEEGTDVVFQRRAEASPSFLEQHSSVEDLIQFVMFDSEAEQSDWVAKEILRNIREDELRHDDIIVINPDPLTTRKNVGLIRRKLLDNGIRSHLAGVDTKPDIFFQSDRESITFTGIFRAKGNEAGMVYIINAQDCHSQGFNLATLRNRLFTAITRSKAWVRVLGVGSGMEHLIDEFNQLKAHQFTLNFRYPTQEERKELVIVHRDMTEADARKIKAKKEGINQFLDAFERGELTVNDLDEEQRQRLRRLRSLIEKNT